MRYLQHNQALSSAKPWPSTESSWRSFFRARSTSTLHASTTPRNAPSQGMPCSGRECQWDSPISSAGTFAFTQHLCWSLRKWVRNCRCPKSRFLCEDISGVDLRERFRTLRSHCGNHPMRRRHIPQVIISFNSIVISKSCLLQAHSLIPQEVATGEVTFSSE